VSTITNKIIQINNIARAPKSNATITVIYYIVPNNSIIIGIQEINAPDVVVCYIIPNNSIIIRILEIYAAAVVCYVAVFYFAFIRIPELDGNICI